MSEVTWPLPEPPARRITEVKEQIDGTSRRFDLECWLWTPELVVARWVAGPDSGYRAPAGLYSWGVWSRTRPYGAYRIHLPDGRLRGYRLDVIERVRISTDEVRYRDLVLDAWIRPGRAVQLEDEDEVEEAVAAGAMTSHEQRRVRCVCELFLRRPEAIMRRVDAAVERALASVEAGGR